jgi:hypothetical protein
MSKESRWYFHSHDDGTVRLLARFEGDGGIVGDACRDLHAGDVFYGIPHERLRKLGAGVIEVSADGAEIIDE